ncbi:MAG: hypothetical protein ACREDK_08585 [Thermoplasmata archaeon]
MSRPRRVEDRPGRRPFTVALVLLVVGGVGAAGTGATRGVTFPPLPVSDGGALVTDLSAPSVPAGGSGTLAGNLHDPLNATITSISVTIAVYAFEATPGGGGPTTPPAGVPVDLTDAHTSGTSITLALADLAANRSEGFGVDVVTSGNAPAGVYAVRIGVAFVEGGTAYRFESRGYFSASQWQNATQLPGNRSTLNLSRLGVSGVVPETAVQVEPASIAPYLYGVLAGALVLAGAGGYYAARVRPKSSSGAREAPDARRAESAFGKSRRSDGD